MPRYAQRAVPAPLGLGHPSWEDECDLDVRDHVTRWSLPAPGGEAELRELVATLLAQPLSRERPLWEMHVIDGLHGGRCAVFQKVHHCMVDGLAGAQLLETLLDATPRALDVATPRTGAPPPPDLATRFGSALLDTAKSQIGLAGSLLGALRGPGHARDALRKLRGAAFSALQIASRGLPAMPWNAPLGPRRRLAFAKLPMEGVRRIRAPSPVDSTGTSATRASRRADSSSPPWCR
jgi:WS/DGAT/MGAT family acyltransferase